MTAEAAARRAELSGVALPESLDFSHQPHTRARLVNLRLVDGYNGFPALVGTVAEGVETSRLFQHSSTKSIAGQTLVVYGIRADELERGRAVRVAM